MSKLSGNVSNEYISITWEDDEGVMIVRIESGREENTVILNGEKMWENGPAMAT